MTNYKSIEEFEKSHITSIGAGFSVEGILFKGGLGNCKFMTVQNIGSLRTKHTDTIDRVFKKLHYHPGVFLTTGGVWAGLELLKKKYKVAYDIEVPIGYGPTGQRHVYILNPYHVTYKNKLDKTLPVVYKYGDNALIGTEITKEAFVEALKKYKRPGNMYNALFKNKKG